MLKTLEWTGSALRLLDQTRLPTDTVYVEITDEKRMWDAIKRLVVRGAPAIGVSAAFGAYLGVRGADEKSFHARLKEVCEYLATSRPTAVNLFWALDRVQRVIKAHGTCSVGGLKQRLLDECLAMIEEDNCACRAIGQHGVQLLRSLKQGDTTNVLTHCNAGSLATVQYGTALAPIYVGAEQGMHFHVYSDETRPLLQGSRITAYELKHNGIPVTR
jgi:methylthioribose-1-phosphate isomerase